MKTDIWKTIDDLNNEYKSLKLDELIDYEKYKLYSLVASSTQLEGGTLDEADTKLLLDDGLTAKGKPMLHHKMVEDNYNALCFAIKSADEKALLSPELLCTINGLNMLQTGEIANTTSGYQVNGTKGEFRKDSRFAYAIGRYPDFQEIPDMVDKFCKEYNSQIKNTKTGLEHLVTSFDAHVNLVLIHPWMDGNKRTSRVLMNFIQRRAGLPLTRVHKEDSKEYWAALKETKDSNDLMLIREFMARQHEKTLLAEILSFKQMNKQNKGFRLIL